MILKAQGADLVSDWKGMPSCVPPGTGRKSWFAAGGPGAGYRAPGRWTVWKWGRGVAGYKNFFWKEGGVSCGESTRRSGKKTVNTSLTGLFPSLFPLQCWPPLLSPARREVRVKTRCFWGCRCPCCTWSSAEPQVFVATFVLPLLRGKGEGLQPSEPRAGWLRRVWGAGESSGAAGMLFRSHRGDGWTRSLFTC